MAFRQSKFLVVTLLVIVLLLSPNWGGPATSALMTCAENVEEGGAAEPVGVVDGDSGDGSEDAPEEVGQEEDAEPPAVEEVEEATAAAAETSTKKKFVLPDKKLLGAAFVGAGGAAFFARVSAARV